MNWIVRSTIKLGFFAWDLSMAAAGCLVLVRGSYRVAREKEGPDTMTSTLTADSFFKPFAGIGIALFLLIFIASEAVTTVRAFRHEPPAVVSLPSTPPLVSASAGLAKPSPSKRLRVHGSKPAIAPAEPIRFASLASPMLQTEPQTVSDALLPAN